MPHRFQLIGLIGRRDDPKVVDRLLCLIRFLTERGHQLLIEEATAAQLGDPKLESAPLNTLAQRCDLAVVVGGDGTLLHAARGITNRDLPLLGINLGRLGFLADVSPHDMLDTLAQILAGNFTEEQRFLLRVDITPSRQGEAPCTALNDVVVHKWNVARMIEFETYVDGRFVETQRSDGLIIATPTGSTAYALSGGGPLLDPALNATVLVPICPHTLSDRPIVVSGDCQIEIIICGRTDPAHVRVTCDGHTTLELQEGDRILIRKHEHAVRLIHPPGHDHFSILRAKLAWSENPV